MAGKEKAAEKEENQTYLGSWHKQTAAYVGRISHFTERTNFIWR